MNLGKTRGIMSQVLYIGDLVRPTAEAAAKARGSLVVWYGQQFKARYPALVVYLPEAAGESCIVAYRLKNGKWKRHHSCSQFSDFDLIHRPSASALLNPFNVNRRRDTAFGHVIVYLAKKYFVVLPYLGGPALVDPDVPIVIRDRPIIPEALGQAVRSSLAAIHSYRDRFVDEHWQQPFFDTMSARSELAWETARSEIATRYEIDRVSAFSKTNCIIVKQLYDCFSLVPVTHSGGAWQSQCCEAYKYLGLGCADGELGRLALELLERPNVAVDHAAKTDPFVGRILPFIDQAAMEADLRRK